MIYFLLIIAFTVFDITLIYLNKKRFGELVYKTSNPLAVFQICITLLLLLGEIFCLFKYLRAPSTYYFYLILSITALVFQLIVHLFMKNGLGEKGISIWGEYFIWERIKSYKLKGNSLLFMVTVQFLGFKYQVMERCRVKPEEINDIEKFLLEHVN